MGEMRNVRLLGSSRRRYEDNIKTDLKGTGYEDVDWIHLGTLVKTAMNLRVP
jgi:hypothetical protein